MSTVLANRLILNCNVQLAESVGHTYRCLLSGCLAARDMSEATCHGPFKHVDMGHAGISAKHSAFCITHQNSRSTLANQYEFADLVGQEAEGLQRVNPIMLAAEQTGNFTPGCTIGLLLLLLGMALLTRAVTLQIHLSGAHS